MESRPICNLSTLHHAIEQVTDWSHACFARETFSFMKCEKWKFPLQLCISLGTIWLVFKIFPYRTFKCIICATIRSPRYACSTHTKWSPHDLHHIRSTIENFFTNRWMEADTRRSSCARERVEIVSQKCLLFLVAFFFRWQIFTHNNTVIAYAPKRL